MKPKSFYKNSDINHLTNFLKTKKMFFWWLFPFTVNFVIYKALNSFVIANLTDVYLAYNKIQLKSKLILFAIPAILLIIFFLTPFLLFLLIFTKPIFGLSYELSMFIKLFTILASLIIWWLFNFFTLKLYFKFLSKSLKIMHQENKLTTNDSDIYQITKITDITKWLQFYIFTNKISNILYWASDNFQPSIQDPITFNKEISTLGQKEKYEKLGIPTSLNGKGAIIMFLPLFQKYYFFTQWISFMKYVLKVNKVVVNLPMKFITFFNIVSYLTIWLIWLTIVCVGIFFNEMLILYAFLLILAYFLFIVPFKNALIIAFLKKQYKKLNWNNPQNNIKKVSIFRNLSLLLLSRNLTNAQLNQALLKVFRNFSLTSICFFYLFFITSTILHFGFEIQWLDLKGYLISNCLIFFIFGTIHTWWIHSLFQKDYPQLQKLKIYHWLFFVPTIFYWFKKDEIK